MNAELIKEGLPINKRARKLNKIARDQLQTLVKNKKSLNSLKELRELNSKNKQNNNLLQ